MTGAVQAGDAADGGTKPLEGPHECQSRGAETMERQNGRRFTTAGSGEEVQPAEGRRHRTAPIAASLPGGAHEPLGEMRIGRRPGLASRVVSS